MITNIHKQQKKTARNSETNLKYSFIRGELVDLLIQ